MSRTDVNSANIKCKGVARVVRHIAHVIAPIENGSHPMCDGRPNADPNLPAVSSQFLILMVANIP